jgi:hypothetical protein
LNKTFVHLLAAALAWILAACSPSPEQQSAMTATTLTTAAARWTPTPIPSPPLPLRLPFPPASSIHIDAHHPNFTPTRTPDPDRYYPPGTSISLVPPEGWVPVSDGQGSVFVGPRRENFFPRIFINEERDDSIEGMYTAQVQDAISADITGYKLIREDLTSPMVYLTSARIPRQSRRWHSICHLYFESGELKEILHYIHTMNSGKRLDKPVEEAILTVRFEE